MLIQQGALGVTSGLSLGPGNEYVSKLFSRLYNRRMTKYVSMLLSELCRDDAVRRKRMKPTKRNDVYSPGVRAIYGQSLSFDHVALLGNPCA